MPFMEKDLLHKIPRILSIILVIFWGLFILLSHGLSVFTLIEGIPWLVLLAITITSHKLEFFGGSMFIMLGLFYVFFTLARFNFAAFLIIPLPFIVTGALFMVSAFYKSKNN